MIGQAPGSRDTGSHKALLPYEIDSEQRRIYDRRVAIWPVRVASILIGVLWIMNMGWRLPLNDFVVPGEPINGIEPNNQVTTQQPGPFVDNGRGLYHWMTLGAQFGNKSPLPFFGDIIKNTMLPNWQFFGWLFFFIEGLAAVSLILGLLSRVGGALGFLQGTLYYLALGQLPGQWTWSFVMLAMFGFVFLFTGPGRFLGLDQLIRPKLREMISMGRTGFRWLYTLT
jgi:hypothetical protein